MVGKLTQGPQLPDAAHRVLHRRVEPVNEDDCLSLTRKLVSLRKRVEYAPSLGYNVNLYGDTRMKMRKIDTVDAQSLLATRTTILLPSEDWSSVFFSAHGVWDGRSHA